MADIVRSRRELILENAMLRHQIVILRRKSPRPRLTTFDPLRFLVAAAVMPTWRRARRRRYPGDQDGRACPEHESHWPKSQSTGDSFA